MSSLEILTSLPGKKVALLGLGIENGAMLEWLLKNKVPASFTICDMRSEAQLGERYTKLSKNKNISWRLGSAFNQGLYDFDVLFRSPGWTTRCSGIKEAKKRNSEILCTSSLNLFMELCPTENVIGVTGTKGKGTTSSLIYEVIKLAKRRVYLGGNIGVAPFSFLDKIDNKDFVVLELSSFQLEDMVHSLKIAVFTNFTKEHLQPADPNNPNYHRNMSEYFAAKANIFSHPECKYLVANLRLESRIKNQELSIRPIYFAKSQLTTKLPGEHNLENIAAAEEVAKLLRISTKVVAKAVLKFKGLEHRLEKVIDQDGIAFYDDSFATTPEATIIALKSFSSPVVVLLGGADKGANFKTLAREVKRRCNFVVLLKGDSTPRIEKSLLEVGYDGRHMKVVTDIETAIKLAISKAKLPGVVLLSTACASFGMFKNYKQRGQLFKEIVLRNFSK